MSEINELSKKTLSSYIKKAAPSAGEKEWSSGYYSRTDSSTASGKKDVETGAKELGKAQKRYKGISRAADRLAKENTEEEQMTIQDMIDFALDRNAVDFTELTKDILSAKAKDVVDIMGESAAKDAIVDPEDIDFEELDELELEDEDDEEVTEEQLEWIAENITEEEFEQLDEISKQKLGQYVVKASRSMAQAHAKEYTLDSWKDHKDWSKAIDTRAKRDSGIKTAVKKLTKEESTSDE